MHNWCNIAPVLCKGIVIFELCCLYLVSRHDPPGTKMSLVMIQDSGCAAIPDSHLLMLDLRKSLGGEKPIELVVADIRTY